MSAADLVIARNYVCEGAIALALLIGIGWLYNKRYEDSFWSSGNVPFYTFLWMIFYGVCRWVHANEIFVIALGILIYYTYTKCYPRYDYDVYIYDKQSLLYWGSRPFPLFYRIGITKDAQSYLRGEGYATRKDAYKYLLFLMRIVLNTEKHDSSSLSASQLDSFRKFLKIENEEYKDNKCYGDVCFQYMIDNPEADMEEYITSLNHKD